MNVLVLEIEFGVRLTPEHYKGRRCVYLFLRTMLRLFTVALTGVTAVYIPFFKEFMGLVGSCCLTVIVFICPVVFDWRLRKLRGETVSTWSWIGGTLILLTGILGGGIGAEQSIEGLLKAMNASKTHGGHVPVNMTGGMGGVGGVGWA
jgi:hypothetical protein